MVSFARHLTFYQNRLSLGKSLRDLHIDAIGKSGSHFFFSMVPSLSLTFTQDAVPSLMIALLET